MRYRKLFRLSFWLLGLLAVLLPSSLTQASGGDGGFEQEVDGYHVQLVFGEHPKTGPNEIEIRISAPDGSPFAGATVEVSPVQAEGEHEEGEIESEHTDSESMSGHDMEELPAEQHDMGEDSIAHETSDGHSESNSHLQEAVGEAGLYAGKITFSQPGDWTVVVRIEAENESVEKELVFPLDVIEVSPPWGVLAGFVGINFSVISVAGFLKKKSAAEKV